MALIVMGAFGILGCNQLPNSTSQDAQANDIQQTATNPDSDTQSSTNGIQQTATNPDSDTQSATNGIQQTASNSHSQSLTNSPTKTSETKQNSASQPRVGTVTNMVNGDLMCYVTLVDENQVKHEVGADFEICANQDKFLNQKVRVSYQIASINDCQSAEPCGKTRQESIITKMEILGQSSTEKSGESQALTNGKWTITIGNTDSWSGVNGTGNLTYRGCDSKGNCINLTGGRVTCRDGICTMGWRNGNYLYTVEQPMDNPDRPSAPGSGTVLTVRQGSKVILREIGFRGI
jgi:hypothetical protein